MVEYYAMGNFVNPEIMDIGMVGVTDDYLIAVNSMVHRPINERVTQIVEEELKKSR